MAYIQLSLFGKTSWERFHQITGWILEPCYNPLQIPKFQCLLLADGQPQEWCEGEALTSHGGAWMPSFGEGPPSHSAENAFLSWQILEGNVPQRYYLSPVICSRILRLAETVGCPPPTAIEFLLLKQGGHYPSSTPFKNAVCVEQSKHSTPQDLSPALESQTSLFQPY